MVRHINRTIGAVLLLLGLILSPSLMAAQEQGPGTLIGKIQARGVLIVGTTANMPPLSMKDKKGDIIGFDADLAKILADSMGVKLQFEVMKFSALMPALQKGKVDIVLSGMTITSGRNLKVAFIGPYLASGKCLLSKEASLAKAGDAEKIDASKVTIAALQGSTSEAFMQALLKEAKYKPVAVYDEGIQLVIDGKVNAMLADYPVCAYALLKHPGAGLISTYSMMTYEPYGIAVQPNDPLLLNWLENRMNLMQETGVLETLKKIWFADDSWIKELP